MLEEPSAESANISQTTCNRQFAVFANYWQNFQASQAENSASAVKKVDS
jgi:hypothetical protein